MFLFKKIFSKSFLKAAALTIVAIALISVGTNWIRLPRSGSAEADLRNANEMAFNNNWMGAAPVYRQAEGKFRAKNDATHALYAHVSQIPAQMESRPLPELIAEAGALLNNPGASDPETRLRILTVKGMLELEYDSALAKGTWHEVEIQAKRLGQWRLASRASGEQGILAFLLGNISEAKDRVKGAYLRAKFLRDQPAEVRYAELIGRGLVEMHQYKQSFRYLDRAISLADSHAEIAKPMIAYEAKATALTGLKRYDEALALISHFLDLSRPRNLRENMAEGLGVKASVMTAKGDWNGAINCYREGLTYAQPVQHWRSVNDLYAGLARAYEHLGRYDDAMHAIDGAIDANRKTPDEIYYVPRNLAIKAEIAEKSGHRKQAESLYRQGEDELEVLMRHVPTPNTERLLLSQLSVLYSGYFTLLADDRRLREAFEVIERAHGRVEAQSLWYDKLKPAQPESDAERTVNALELKLLDVADDAGRKALLERISDAEEKLPSYSPGPFRQPVALASIQKQLRPGEVLLEYVLGSPTSSVLAITNGTVRRYSLPSKDTIEEKVGAYTGELQKKKVNVPLAQELYRALLPQSLDMEAAQTLVIVPDGILNLASFAALADSPTHYLIASKSIINAPSATVLNLLRTREQRSDRIPYLGVAAWTQTADTRPWVVRAIEGPERAQLVPLPESKREIEAAAEVLPRPETLLLGSDATRSKFLSLPLNRYDVLHLSLHGYPDMEFPDRSALVFAPAPELKDSGFLQAREIRNLHLNARLVTLSACKTSVGPTYETGTASIVNAFIEAGAQSVVSTLWDVDDRAGRKLMEAFYKHLAAGEGRAEALQHAETEFANAGEPPYYWANFQIVGDAVAPLYSGHNVAELRKPQ
jgi:CHAT domain-containing protein